MATGSNKVEIEVKANVTGEESVGALGHALDSTGTAAKKLGTDATGAAGGVGTADVAAKGFTATSGELRDGLDSVSVQLADAKNQLLAFVGVQGFANSVQDVAALADSWANMKSRLQLALGAQVDVNTAMADVEGIAKRSYSSLDATANLYGKIASIGKEMGVSQQQALTITETINKSIQLSGASAQASEAAITQLIQGLQGGVLRGDEFNSIMEQSPRLAQAMAAGLNVPISALRGLAEAGKLTSTEVIRALQNQSEAIGNEFAALPLTVGRAVQNLQTEWHKFIGTMDSSTGASAGAAASIGLITRHLDDLARLAAETGAALTAAFAIQAAGALRAFVAQMVVTGGAAALLRRDLDTLSKPVQITIAVTGFEAGYQLGTMLYENSVWARKLGVVMTEIGLTIVNDLQLIEEATAAIFTKDTIGKAVERYSERSKKMVAITKDMFADAEKAPEKVGTATDAAGAKMTAMGVAATAAGNNVAHAGATGAAGVAGIGGAAEDARGALEKLAAQLNAPIPVDNGIGAVVRDLIAAKNRAQDVDKVIRTELPEAISKLSGPELVKFRSEFIAAMDAAKQALKDAIDTGKPRAEIDALLAKVASLEKDTRSGLGKIAEQAAKSLGVDVPQAFNQMSAGFLKADDNMAVLIRSMPELKAAGVDAASVVGQALSNMVAGANSQEELKRVEERILALGKAGQLAKPAVDALLDEAKNKALDLKDALDEAKPGIDSLREAAKKAGVDIGELTTGVSKGFKDGLDDVDKLAASIKAAGTDAKIAEVQLAKALDQRLVAAQTTQEVQLVIAEYKKLGSQGQLTGDNLKDGLQKGQDKLSGMTKGVNDLREAYAQLGLKTPEELKKIADANAAAWEKVKGDSSASLETLKAAFNTYAQSAIAASGDVGSSQRRTTEAMLQQEAAAKGLTISFDENGRVCVEAQSKAGDAVNRTTEGLRGQRGAVDDVTAALEKQNAALERTIAAQEKANALAERATDLENKRLKRDRDGFSTGANGQRVVAGGDLNTATGIQKFLQEAGVRDEAQAKAITREFLDSQGNVQYSNNPGQIKYGGDTISMALLKAAERITFGAGGAGVANGFGGGGGAPPAAPVNTNSSTFNSPRPNNAQPSTPPPRPPPAPAQAPAVAPTDQSGGAKFSRAGETNLTINVAAGVNMASRSQVESLARAIAPALNNLQRKGALSQG